MAVGGMLPMSHDYTFWLNWQKQNILIVLVDKDTTPFYSNVFFTLEWKEAAVFIDPLQPSVVEVAELFWDPANRRS